VRKMAMMVAILVLAGCDAGKAPDAPKVQAQAASPAASQVATPEWDIQMNAKEAVSDIAAWLVEHGYASFVAKVDGKDQVLLGPYSSQAEAEQKLAELIPKLNKATRFADPVVIQRTP